MHRQPVLASCEDPRLVHKLVGAVRETSLSGDEHVRRPLPVLSESGSLFLVGVRVDHNRQPELLHIVFGQSVHEDFLLEVVVVRAVLKPLERDLKLKCDVESFYSLKSFIVYRALLSNTQDMTVKSVLKCCSYAII